MSEQEPKRSIELTDPRALRALAHPTRLALVGLLRSEGPLTATRAGELLGESPASCSFHLRQLAKYGLVEEAGGGTGRQRPWRATAMFTSWPYLAHSPEMATASAMLTSFLAEIYFDTLLRWIESRDREPAGWQEAELFGDRIMYLTAEELAELTRAVRALTEPYDERTQRRELRPPGSREVTFLRFAFPTPPRARPRQGDGGDEAR